MKKKELFLIDSHALIHRAYHALPPLTTPDGRPIGAVYGLARAVIKTLRDHNPDYVVAAFDRPEETFRKSEYKEYKANREKAPDDLISQFEIARELFKKMGIAVVDAPGFEADDIIGTLAQLSKSENIHVTILTGDLDSLQLVKDDFVSVETPQKGIGEMKEYHEIDVINKLGVDSAHVIDYKGLVGDPSDNIPGIPGVGPKTALKLLSEFSSVENLFEKINSEHPFFKKVYQHKDIALLSKRLATIHTNAPISKTLNSFVFHPFEENDSLKEFFLHLGFKNMFPQKSFFSEKREKTNITAIPVCTHTDIPENFDDSMWYLAFNWKEIIQNQIKNKKKIPKQLIDISILFWLLHPDLPSYSYQEITQYLLKTPIPSPTNESLLQLFNEIMPQIEREELMGVYTTYEMPLIPLLVKMEMRGIKIESNLLHTLKKELEKSLQEIQEKIFFASKKEFNIASPKQVGELLESIGVFEKIKKTKTGQIKTDRETLELLAETNPIVQDILLYREQAKVLSGFVEPLLSLAQNDVIHTTYLQNATGTGRLSSEKPNLQNIPQESEWSIKIRSAFVPREGFSFVSFDYSQLELRLLASESRDKTLINAFLEKKDIHTITASKIFHKESESVSKQERRIGKTLNFGIIYGMGPRAFAKTSGVSFEEANHFMSEYFALFPGVNIWQEHIKEFTKEHGYVKNIHGRRRWFSIERFGEFERAIINMPLQSLGADIMKTSIISLFNFIETNKYFESVVPILTIHDELLIEIRNDMIDIITPKIKEIMESVESLLIPLSVEIKAGNSWGVMKPVIYE